MGTNNGNGTQRPKLDPELNQEVRVRLLKDKPYTSENSLGRYWLYSVQNVETDEELAFFAPAEIHQIIEEQKLGKGSEFLIKKVALQNGKKSGSKLELSLVSAPPPLLDHISTTGDSMKDTMAQCLKDAVELTKQIEGVPWRSEDIQKVAVALFIARTK